MEDADLEVPSNNPFDGIDNGDLKACDADVRQDDDADWEDIDNDVPSDLEDELPLSRPGPKIVETGVDTGACFESNLFKLVDALVCWCREVGSPAGFRQLCDEQGLCLSAFVFLHPF